MHEFETFVYLDTQKTGSTFISYILRRHIAEKEILHSKHQPVGDRYDPDKFHFISVRDPLDQYISLYSYGCKEGGRVYQKLENGGHKDLYDSTWRGFRRWLRFVLDPENDEILLARRKRGLEEFLHLIGFQTYRFLELALPDANAALHACKTRDDIRAAYRANSIPRFTIRHERFNADLEELFTTHLRSSIADLDAMLEAVHGGWRLNQSERVDQFEDNPRLGGRMHGLLREREWLLAELFGYQPPE